MRVRFELKGVKMRFLGFGGERGGAEKDAEVMDRKQKFIDYVAAVKEIATLDGQEADGERIIPLVQKMKQSGNPKNEFTWIRGDNEYQKLHQSPELNRAVLVLDNIVQTSQNEAAVEAAYGALHALTISFDSIHPDYGHYRTDTLEQIRSRKNPITEGSIKGVHHIDLPPSPPRYTTSTQPPGFGTGMPVFDSGSSQPTAQGAKLESNGSTQTERGVSANSTLIPDFVGDLPLALRNNIVGTYSFEAVGNRNNPPTPGTFSEVLQMQFALILNLNSLDNDVSAYAYALLRYYIDSYADYCERITDPDEKAYYLGQKGTLEDILAQNASKGADYNNRIRPRINASIK
jgi:hypothetical protein